MDVRQEGKRKTTDKLKEEEDSQNLVNNPAKISLLKSKYSSHFIPSKFMITHLKQTVFCF